MKFRLPKFRPTFRLRTLLILVAIVAVALSPWVRYRRIRILVQEHHYACLAAGYTAVLAQRPDDNQWVSAWRKQWEWPAPLRMDRGAMKRAFPHWEKSVRHAKLRDHYLQVSEYPWRMFFPAPNVAGITPLPRDDHQLSTWWDSQIASHVASNGLNHTWGSYPDSTTADRDLAILNIAPASFNRFLHLRDIMPVKDGWNDDDEIIAAAKIPGRSVLTPEPTPRSP